MLEKWNRIKELTKKFRFSVLLGTFPTHQSIQGGLSHAQYRSQKCYCTLIVSLYKLCQSSCPQGLRITYGSGGGSGSAMWEPAPLREIRKWWRSSKSGSDYHCHFSLHEQLPTEFDAESCPACYQNTLTGLWFSNVREMDRCYSSFTLHITFTL